MGKWTWGAQPIHVNLIIRLIKCILQIITKLGCYSGEKAQPRLRRSHLESSLSYETHGVTLGQSPLPAFATMTHSPGSGRKSSFLSLHIKRQDKSVTTLHCVTTYTGPATRHFQCKFSGHLLVGLFSWSHETGMENQTWAGMPLTYKA